MQEVGEEELELSWYGQFMGEGASVPFHGNKWLEKPNGWEKGEGMQTRKCGLPSNLVVRVLQFAVLLSSIVPREEASLND